MKAHPTTYGGVNFRSRLEAKWAAFFDLLGWRWQYEPIDLEGWTPDFSIQCHDGPIYVEVKPIEWVGDVDQNTKDAMERSDLKKVFNCKTERERLILGTAPCFMSRSTKCDMGGHGDNFGVLFGSTGRPFDDLQGCDGAVVYFKAAGKYDFAGSWGSWQYRIHGDWDGKNHLRDVSLTWLESKWREACNRVQWRASVAA
jgi:hypothetical protein